MKKISIISTIALAVLATSCRKQLDQTPISNATTATFYKQPVDFIQGINAAYSSLRGYPDRLLYLSEIRSDNIYGVTQTGRDWDPINSFGKGIAPNTYVEEAWRENFYGVFRANTVLDQLTKNASYAGSPALVTRLQAEAHFLRAFFYFDLVHYFGGVPVVDHPLTPDEANGLARGSVSDVYKLIISDLQFAIANLPTGFTGTFPNYTAADLGRATKYSAEALLARVYITRSGPNYGIDGPGMASNEWSQAMPLLQDVISSGQFAFNTTSYANIFSYSNQSPSTNKEAVFDIMYLAGQTPIVGADFPWQLAPQNYFNSLGTNTAANGALGDIPVSTNMMNSYEATDNRKAFTVNTAGFTYLGSFDGAPFYKKWIDLTKIPTNSRFDWGINYIAIRYTDVLMMKAECILNGGGGGTQTDVNTIVNQVRNRAGLLPIVGNVTLAQLFDERRHEFADEGLRWFDLQRQGNIVNTMNAFIVTDDVEHKMAQMNVNYIIYPVPQSQTDAAPGLYTQNPGY